MPLLRAKLCNLARVCSIDPSTNTRYRDSSLLHFAFAIWFLASWRLRHRLMEAMISGTTHVTAAVFAATGAGAVITSGLWRSTFRSNPSGPCLIFGRTH